MLISLCTLWVTLVYAQSEQAQPDSAGPDHEVKLGAQQLDSLVSPIALYPDPLLAQILAASTYPIQIVEAERWLGSNSALKGKALVKKAAEQDWEPSIQALVVFPSVLRRMNQNLNWTTSLGNAFLDEQSEVMSAVQRMRRKAYDAGQISSNSRQNVAVQSADGQSVIVIEPADPQVIYVPSYNPMVVYGAAPGSYPYPVMDYPSTGAILAADAISFGAGVALGAAFDDCCGYAGWGWGCNWGDSSVTVNNNFFGRYGYATPYGRRAYGTAAWTHNPYYRGAVPYSSASVAGRYGKAGVVRTPYGSAGAIDTAHGEAAAVRTPYGSASRVETDSGWSSFRGFGSSDWRQPSAFSGLDRDGGWARSSSDRGFRSMGGWGGGGWGGGRFGGGGFGGGFRGGGFGRRR